MKGIASRLGLVAVAIGLVTAACGGSSDGGGLLGGTNPSTTRATTTSTSAPTTTAAPTTTDAPTTTTTAPTTTTSSTTTSTTTSTTSTTTTTMATTTTAGELIDLPVGQPYSGYEMFADDSGLLEIRLPDEWTDRSGLFWDFDGENIGPAISAASDYDAWLSGWDTAGLFLGATNWFNETPDQYLDVSDFSGDCTYEGREDYDDGEYVGRFDTWFDCGPANSVFVELATEPYEGGGLVILEFVLVTQADLEALESALASFRLLGQLP